MYKLYFINEKWPANVREYGLSSSSHVLHSAFVNTGLGKYESFHFDEYFYEHNKMGDFKLIEEIMNYKPDLIVYSWLAGIYNPEIETFKILHKMNNKIACIWWDFSWDPSIEASEKLSPFVDAHIIMDNPFASFQIPMHSKRKHLPLWTPNDQTIFYGDPLSERDIDIQFGGDVYRNDGYRKDYIEKIEDLNYNIFISGKKKEERVPINEYTEKMRNVKIIPNFTQGTMKGRIFEAMLCGAMLMEPKKSLCGTYFTPNVDYVEYTDVDDFFDKIKYYLENDEERIQIAKSGHEKMLRKYNTKRFWQIVFDKIGISTEKYVSLYQNDMKIDELIDTVFNPILEVAF